MCVKFWKLPLFFLLMMGVSGACERLPRPGNTPAPAQPATRSLEAPPSPSTPPQQAATPTAAETPAPVCNTHQGSLQTGGEISAPQMDKPLRYQVYLPPCAESQPNRLPVLYLLHGQASDETQWLRLGLQQAMDELLQKPGIRPFAVVLPFDYSYKQPREYGFEQAFLTRLMPEAQSRFGLSALSAENAIGGLSRGGAWALYLGSRHPELFAAIGAHSPALFYSDTGSFPLRLRSMEAGLRPAFYLDAGQNDPNLSIIEAMVQTLDELGFAYEWHANQGFHDEKYWSTHLPAYLAWYALQFQRQP